jgi:energy-coupling factor transport system ATP-binding protein
MIRIEDLTYTYRTRDLPVLKNISLSLPKGPMTILTGPSGSGKTTLCRAMAGILSHVYTGKATGTITIAGRDIMAYKGIEELSHDVSMVFDDADAQLIFTTVGEEVMTSLENRGLLRKDAEDELTRLLDLLEIASLKERTPYTLSGGQKQKAAIAATLALDSAVLILDEATSELDAEARNVVFSILRQLADQGRTIVLVEHMIDEAAAFADACMLIEGGQITASGTPAEVSRRIQETLPPITKRSGTGGGALFIEAEDLVHCYGDHRAVDGVDFTLRSGEIVAIVGENGSGKTTLVKHFNGLLKPTEGRLRIKGTLCNGQSISTLSRHTGLVFQNPDTMLFEDTVHKEIAFGLKNIGKDIGCIGSVLAEVGLAGREDTNPRHLSRGERQRLALACVIAMDQEVFVLDEPTTGLDLAESLQIMGILMRLANEGHGIVMITHNPGLATAFADRVMKMSNGRFISSQEA